MFTAIVLLLTACGNGSSTVAPQVDDTVELVRVACVGDSITQGYGLENPSTQSYPSQLASMLGAGWSVQNYGLTGTTVLQKGDDPYIQSATYAESQVSSAEIVVIQLGSNDSKPDNWQHKQDFVTDYIALIESYQALESNPQIWIAYPPPAFPGFAGISNSVIRDEMIPLIASVAQATGVGVIDPYSVLSSREDLFPDTVHPNAEGARIIAETVYGSIY
jgi:lysophospholipase L1-like esterase